MVSGQIRFPYLFQWERACESFQKLEQTTNNPSSALPLLATDRQTITKPTVINHPTGILL